VLSASFLGAYGSVHPMAMAGTAYTGQTGQAPPTAQAPILDEDITVVPPSSLRKDVSVVHMSPLHGPVELQAIGLELADLSIGNPFDRAAVRSSQALPPQVGYPAARLSPPPSPPSGLRGTMEGPVGEAPGPVRHVTISFPEDTPLVQPPKRPQSALRAQELDRGKSPQRLQPKSHAGWMRTQGQGGDSPAKEKHRKPAPNLKLKKSGNFALHGKNHSFHSGIGHRRADGTGTPVLPGQ